MRGLDLPVTDRRYLETSACRIGAVGFSTSHRLVVRISGGSSCAKFLLDYAGQMSGDCLNPMLLNNLASTSLITLADVHTWQVF